MIGAIQKRKGSIWHGFWDIWLNEKKWRTNNMYAVSCKKDGGGEYMYMCLNSEEKFKKDKIETKTVGYLQNGDENGLQDISK